MTGLLNADGRPINPRPNCDVTGCPSKAAYRVGALLWAKGAKAGSHEPYPVLSSLSVCDVHKAFPTVKNVFTDQAKEEITAHLRRDGKREPDFETAKIHLSPIRT